MTLAERRRLKKKSHNLSSLVQQKLGKDVPTSTYLVNYIN